MSFEPKFQGSARFEVRRPLGEGGMGAVYEVIDHERGARAALKVLSRMSPASIEQFKNEFRGLAGVLHPNLVRMHELVAESEHWLFTMDLVDGVPFIRYVRADERDSVPMLSESAVTRQQAVTIQGVGSVDPLPVRSGQLDERRLRAALAQLAAGVHAIHNAGKVHRDIKHSNVLVDTRGRVAILDFGLVADAAQRSDEDAPGGVWGTPAYMAPEQAAGKVATAASDWYAVGVMLYEALTGRLPFAGKAQEVLLAKQRAEPIAPSAWVRDVPADLEALCLSLLRFRADERPSGRDVLERLGVNVLRESSADLPSRPTFVGRAREIEALRGVLQQSLPHAQVAIVEGVSGMGKSALVDEAIAVLRRADPNLVVLAGRCYARESVPFKAFDGPIDALAQHFSSLPEMELASLIPPGTHALTQMFPALLRVPSLKRLVDEEPLPADPKELRRRAFSCLRALLDRVARTRPLLVYVDDLQWGDEDSARLWIDLLSGSDSPPLSWLCTFRSDEQHHSPCLRVLFGPDGIERHVALRIKLSALSTEEMTELARGLLPEAVLADAQSALMREAGGNPYFALELAREIQRRPLDANPTLVRPVTLEQALSQRVNRLPTSAQRLLRVVSVAARPLDQKAAFRAAGLGYEGLSSLTELQNAHLVRLLGAESHLIAAYHDRIRETVTDGLSATDVRQVHGALALAFEQHGDADPELLTEHLLGAGELPRAARYAVVAAEQAARTLAFGRAARLYQLALEHTTASAEERERWSVGLAEALVNAGRGADAARVYLEAASASTTHAAELRRLGAEQLILSGHIDEGIAVLGDELRACGLSLPAPGHALATTMELAAQLRERGLAFEACEPSALAPATALRLEVCWAVALGFTGSEPERLMPIVLQHLLDALDAGSPFHVLRALCLFIGNGATATRPGSRTIAGALAAAEALREVVNTPDADAWIAQVNGMTRFLSWGDASAALPYFEVAERTFRDRCRGVSREIGLAQVGILASLAERGNIAEYRTRYPAYLKDAEERSDLYLTMYHRSYHAGFYYLTADDPDRAWSEVDAAAVAWGRSSFDQCALFSLLSRLEVLLYRGGPAAYEWSQAHGPNFLGSILATGHYFRARFFSLRGRAAVLAAWVADVDPAAKALLLSEAQQDLSELEESDLKVSPGLALALRASIQATQGERDAAAATLDKLASARQAEGDVLLATCAKVQQARVMRNALGTGLHTTLLAELRAQGIQHPERWVAMLIPIP